ncbi:MULTISPECIES: glycosyltransferase [Streptomyces]|uniref:glycosyltransferase n=1 Tax=Streptomyces TaxID=1883 RepID=UPI00081BB83D|nr:MULTISPECIES: glycosyltransferase [unclassified Streptomyces]MYQ52253.1 glycosyltransferase [Streptomyces sp. SID4941]SCD78739.1 Glycosyltransferase involved in cell wall bisynthesis [Streptomyces sp. PalvLS-984]SDC92690.1 Glycosyltransferase involved in cell wall bisynthesis [Streptomyces sp. AmelKG-A3]
MSRTHPAPLRVALVSEHASPLAELGGPDAGGQNVYVAQLARHLALRGHDVTVYTRRDEPGLPPEVVTPGGVTVVHVPAGPAARVPKDELLSCMPEFGEFLARRWQAAPPDVAHAHFWMSGTAALAGARGPGVPVVQTYHALGTVKRRHQGAGDPSPPQRLAIEAAIGRACRRVLATCADEVAELAAMGVRRDRVSVVPCGVDPHHFAPVEAPARTAPGPRRLVAVGRLVRRKGFDRAIRALADLPDAELLIAGGPEGASLWAEPEAHRLRKVADDHGVADRVTLLGAVSPDRMPALMSGADLVLSLPDYEPFGIVPIEAMACRTPVVATAVGGHLDTVLDGVTGALVPSSATDDHLADVIRTLLQDRERLTRYGRAGRERVLAHYSWDRVTDGVARVYSAVRATPSLSGAVR